MKATSLMLFLSVAGCGSLADPALPDAPLDPNPTSSPLEVRLLPFDLAGLGYDSLKLQIAAVNVKTTTRTLSLSHVPTKALELAVPNQAYPLGTFAELEDGEDALSVKVTFAPSGSLATSSGSGTLETGGTSLEFPASRSLMKRQRIVIALDVGRSLAPDGPNATFVPSWRILY